MEITVPIIKVCPFEFWVSFSLKYLLLIPGRVLVSSFTEDQLNRYEMYRRSAFPKASIKKVMFCLMTPPPGNNSPR